MSSHRRVLDLLRRSFWLLPTAGIAAGACLGYALPAIDAAVAIDSIVEFRDARAARSLLEMIATATLSVASIAFSVTVVALQLASQQLSPRVLRTFQDNRLAQVTLEVFLGTFAYVVAALAILDQDDRVPEASVTVAIAASGAGLVLFVAFVHDIVNSLQASTLIRRMAADAHEALVERFPGDVGEQPVDERAAREELDARRRGLRTVTVAAPRAGYVRALDGRALLAAAVRRDGVVVQRARIGDFVLTGGALAEVWAARDADLAAREVGAAFDLGDQRTIVQDVAFPVRQLADVALRALSPSLNDPTTAENAMGSLADTIARFIRGGRPSDVRIAPDGRPRLLTRSPDVDHLVRVGFDEVRVAAAGLPSTEVRLLALLDEIAEVARELGVACAEVERQRRLLGARSGSEAPTAEDAARVRERL